jgi:hypothetical protein
MKNTVGFYKLDGEILLHAPNEVSSAFYDLSHKNHEQYEYPVDGWYWFDSEEQAREFFGLPPIEPVIEPLPWTN